MSEILRNQNIQFYFQTTRIISTNESSSSNTQRTQISSISDSSSNPGNSARFEGFEGSDDETPVQMINRLRMIVCQADGYSYNNGSSDSHGRRFEPGSTFRIQVDSIDTSTTGTSDGTHDCQISFILNGAELYRTDSCALCMDLQVVPF